MVERVGQLFRREELMTRKENLKAGMEKNIYPVKKEGTNVLKEIK